MNGRRWLSALAGLVLLLQGVAAAWAAPCLERDAPCCAKMALCDLACSPAALPAASESTGAAHARPGFDVTFTSAAPRAAHTLSPFRPPAH